MLGAEDDAVNDNLRNRPFYDRGRTSPAFNLLFAALWDLILPRITKMGIFAPEAGSSIEDVFNMKAPALADDEDAVAEISGENT